ncbi:unnamed protein product [Prunus armeniaca]
MTFLDELAPSFPSSTFSRFCSETPIMDLVPWSQKGGKRGRMKVRMRVEMRLSGKLSGEQSRP